MAFDVDTSVGSSKDYEKGQAVGAQQTNAEIIENIQNSLVMALGSSVELTPYMSGSYEGSQESELTPSFSANDEEALDLAASILGGDVSKEGGGAATGGGGLKNTAADAAKNFFRDNYLYIGGAIILYFGAKYLKKIKRKK